MTIRLDVPTAALVHALTPLAILKSPTNIGDALIGYQAGHLRIELGGVAGTAKAEGNWPGEARVSPDFVLSLAARLAPQGRAVLLIEDGKLVVRAGTATIQKSCVWETSARPSIALPMNPSLQDLVRVALIFTPPEIERVGLKEPVKSAKGEMEALLAKAAQTLEPLGVTIAEIRELVKAKCGPAEAL